MDKKLIVANWKNHPNSLAEAQQILDFIDEYLGSTESRFSNIGLVFCPPFVFIEEVAKILKTSHLVSQSELGAQDIFWDDSGSSTGEISGPMLTKLGVRYVIIGHSERRWKLNESNEIVNKKLRVALRNELVPIVCIGEKTRDDNFREFVKEQLIATFNGLFTDEISRCIIAYEPVWAISTNQGSRPDTPESANESLKIIENTLIRDCKLEIRNLPKILYGGSITSANAKDFLHNDKFDGVLVGGASVNKEEFIKILSQA